MGSPSAHISGAKGDTASSAYGESPFLRAMKPLVVPLQENVGVQSFLQQHVSNSIPMFFCAHVVPARRATQLKY